LIVIHDKTELMLGMCW